MQCGLGAAKRDQTCSVTMEYWWVIDKKAGRLRGRLSWISLHKDVDTQQTVVSPTSQPWYNYFSIQRRRKEPSSNHIFTLINLIHNPVKSSPMQVTMEGKGSCSNYAPAQSPFITMGACAGEVTTRLHLLAHIWVPSILLNLPLSSYHLWHESERLRSKLHSVAHCLQLVTSCPWR